MDHTSWTPTWLPCYQTGEWRLRVDQTPRGAFKLTVMRHALLGPTVRPEIPCDFPSREDALDYALDKGYAIPYRRTMLSGERAWMYLAPLPLKRHRALRLRAAARGTRIVQNVVRHLSPTDSAEKARMLFDGYLTGEVLR